MLEEPAPLIERDDEHRVVQVARVGEGVVDIRDEPLAAPDVRLGMVVGPGSSPLAELLKKEGTYADAIAVSGDDALDSARRATVHVLCLY